MGKNCVEITFYQAVKLFEATKKEKPSNLVEHHYEAVKNAVSQFKKVYNTIYSVDDYVKDFKGIAKTHSPDELRAKIEEKIVNNNSPFKGVQKLKDLFQRSTSQHIDNLANLLEICQKAEMIDMDYDLKFKLRYLISNTLLYGKNNY